jgi:hypothetical protein
MLHDTYPVDSPPNNAVKPFFEHFLSWLSVPFSFRSSRRTNRSMSFAQQVVGMSSSLSCKSSSIVQESLSP